jgi:ribosomal-protein-alanine N-acetyltransferase
MTSIRDITGNNYLVYLESILQIENLSFLSPWSPQAFQGEIKNPFSRLWALMVDDVLTGYICFWVFDREIQLVNIAVHPLRRGKGLGCLLLTKMIEKGISGGKESIWLEVRPSNLAARRLYHKLGFEAVDRRPRYYSDTNEDAIVMMLALPAEIGYRLASN